LGTLKTLELSKFNQYIVSIALIMLVSTLSYTSKDIIGYRVVALILLLAVSISAMLFDILPVLISALLSAIILNFFFIPPTFNFNIDTSEDVLMFSMYFIVALINAVLTFKIRQFERRKQNEKEKEKSIQLYDIILNSLSHELRTPIATIIGAIDTINDNENKLSQENKKELYNEIEVASNRLNRQVENLLSMSRLEAGTIKTTYDWFDVNEMIFSVIKENANDAKNHTIVFNPNENLSLIKIDGGFLEMILHNLIHNALQHTPAQTTILIDVECVDGTFNLKISDNGLGFAKEEINFVFDKFYRINSSATGGTGLGLSIVKGFAEALNGHIFLKSIKGTGASFTLTIPVETSSLNHIKNE